MNLTRRAIRRLWLLPLLAAGALLTAPLLPREHRLLRLATPRADVSDWYLKRWADSHWMSTHEVMFFREKPGHKVWIATARDLTTGRETVLTAFSAIYNQTGGDPQYTLDVADDGQSALWVGDNKDYACGLDGNRFLRIPISRVPETLYAYWLGTGEIFQLGRSSPVNEIPVLNMRDSRLKRKLALQADCPLLWPDFNAQCLRTGQARFLSEARMVFSMHSGDNEYKPTDAIYDFRLGRNVPPPRIYKLPAPAHATLLAVQIAPQADRVARLIKLSRVPPLLALLHRLIPAIKAPTQTETQLVVSRLDGRDSREIGVFEARDAPGAEPGDFGYHLQWLPDGKTLSFIQGRSLYTISAD